MENNINESNSSSLSAAIPNTQAQTKEKSIEEIGIMDGAPEGAIESTSMFDQIAQAKQMLDAGIITDEEFSAIKAKLIAKL